MTYNPYEVVSRDIVQQLQPIKSLYNIEVKDLPNRPNNFASVAGEGWLVFWINNIELEDYSLSEMTACEIVNYNLDLRFKDMRDGNGLLDIIYAVRALLWGFQPEVCYKPITTLDMEFQGTAENYWVITGAFTCYLLAGYSQFRQDLSDAPLVEDVTVGDNVIIPIPE